MVLLPASVTVSPESRMTGEPPPVKVVVAPAVTTGDTAVYVIVTDGVAVPSSPVTSADGKLEPPPPPANAAPPPP